MSWYKTGTIAATNGSKIITGIGTQFTNPLNSVSAGRMLLLPAAGTVQIYEIESVQSDTQLTLVSAFTGTTGTGKAYAIPTSPAVSIEQFAHEFASTLTYYQQQLSGWQQILTGAGNVTLTTPDGQTVTVRSQQAWDAALNGKANSSDVFLLKGALGTNDLNNVIGTDYQGIWWQNATANATAARNYPVVSAGNLLVLYNSVTSYGITQIYITHVSKRIFIRSKPTPTDAWTMWGEFWTSDNLVKQTGVYDNAAGRVLTFQATNQGPFGLGSAVQVPISQQSQFFSYSDTAAAGVDLGTSQNGVGYQSAYNTNRRGQIFQSFGDGQLRHRISTLSTIADTTTPWRLVWDNANLVKQTGPFDLTDGSMMINGAWGWGARGQVINSNDAAVLDFGRNPLQGSRIFRNDTTSAYTKQYGPSLLFKVADTWSIISVGYAASGASGGIRIAAGNNSGGNTVSHELWTNLNLNPVKDAASYVSVTDAASLHSWALDASNTSSTIRNDGVSPATVRYGSGWFSKVSGTYSVLTAGPSASTQTVKIQAGDANGYVNYELATLNTTQTITGEKTFTGGLVDSATNIGRLTSPSPVALTAVAQLRAMRNGGILFVDGSNSTAALMPNGSTSGYWFITSIGKNDTTSLAGMYYAVQQGTTGDFCIGFLTAAGVITWNALMNVNATQNISGAKTFTSAPRIQATNATLNQESTAVTEATVGRWVQPTNQGNAYRFYVRAGSGGAPISGGERIITMPTTATGAILVSGNNAVADSNGFYKTASPVVKLFSNGTSELTSEAEGITTERLSEGVYRISGCLGLNADRAWGGDDGGIDVPMCRNKLPRLWVDYGGDEGSEQINPDGSIVIRTYHRPHPDAPAFARNEIEGYANGDPIDIPHDTFISVRVQMPEVEVQEAVVETLPNQAENEVVLETSTQA